MTHYHFSGICGTAMASLAVLLKNRGQQVTGSDQNIYPPMSTLLEENKIQVFSGYRPAHLQPHPDFVVLGNALSRGNPEVEYALKEHLHYLSMAELLKNEFIRGRLSLVISGTHGKSSTAGLTAHLFAQAGRPTGFMIGGIPLNFDTSARDVAAGGYFVVEGDEYDTSFFDKRSKFFHYLPDRLIINNIEFDHADIFNNLEEIKKSFILALRQMPENGLILVNGDDENAVEVARQGFCPLVTFGLGSANDAVIEKLRPNRGAIGMTFTLNYEGEAQEYSLPLFGEFNVRNATAVILLALHEGLSRTEIQAGLSSYKGVKRRLERLTTNDQVRVFDDFAHHPTAIAETIKALRHAWPEAKIHAIYEARSNTSVRKFHQIKMAEAFMDADQITFYKLHRGESLPPENRLDLNQVVTELVHQGKEAAYIEEIEEIAAHALQQAKPGELILVMSQGAFAGLARRLAQALDQQYG